MILFFLLLDDRINVEKASLIGKAILAVVDGLRRPYAFASDPRIRKLLLSGDVWDDNEIYRISQLKEARMTDAEKAAFDARVKRSGRIGELASRGLGARSNVDTESHMSSKDWELLMALGSSKRISSGKIIVQPGETLTQWYRIAVGVLHVDVQSNDGWQRVRTLADGAMFGHAEALLFPHVSSNQTLFRVTGKLLFVIEIFF